MCTFTLISVQYSTVQYSTVQYSTVQYSTVQTSLEGDMDMDTDIIDCNDSVWLVRGMMKRQGGNGLIVRHKTIP